MGLRTLPAAAPTTIKGAFHRWPEVAKSPPEGWTEPCPDYYDPDLDAEGWIVKGEVTVAHWIVEATYAGSADQLAKDLELPEFEQEVDWRYKVTSTGQTWLERLQEYPNLLDWLNVGGVFAVYEVAKLAERQREAIDLQTLHLNKGEIAEEMGVAVSTVRSHLQLAWAGINALVYGTPRSKVAPGTTGRPRGRPWPSRVIVQVQDSYQAQAQSDLLEQSQRDIQVEEILTGRLQGVEYAASTSVPT